MNKLLSTTALIAALAIATPALAHMQDDDYGTPLVAGHSALSVLPPADAKQVHDTMQEARDENRQLMQKEHQLHQDIYDILTAPSFDQDKFLDKSKELRDLHAQMEANLNESFTTAVAGLPQNERIRLANAWRHHEKKHHSLWSHHTKSQTDSGSPEGAGHENSEYPSPSSTPVRP